MLIQLFTFFLTGVDDVVRCYRCGGGLRDWERGDDPWFEHAKWFSKCPYVLLTQGQSFIDKVINEDCIEEDPLKPNEVSKKTLNKS